MACAYLAEELTSVNESQLDWSKNFMIRYVDYLILTVFR